VCTEERLARGKGSKLGNEGDDAFFRLDHGGEAAHSCPRPGAGMHDPVSEAFKDGMNRGATTKAKDSDKFLIVGSTKTTAPHARKVRDNVIDDIR
jgi:hypothetical protein